jgi:NitT/TauT family transport system substrate-binding protein
MKFLQTVSSLLVLSVCWCSPALGQARAFKICAPDYSGGTMHFLIAKHVGFYKQEGLDVEVLAARGNLCTTALIAGSVQFTSSPSTFDSLVAGDIAGKVIYVSAKFLLHSLVVAPDIKTFADLKGKRIAISSFGTLTDQLTREILIDHGLKPMTDVLLLQTGQPGVRYAALKSNRVHGALLSSQHTITALQEGFRELKYNPPPYLSQPLITTDEILKKQNQAVRGLLRGTIKGHLFFEQKPEETVALMQKLLRIDDTKQTRLFYEDEKRRSNSGGGFPEASMKRVIERAIESRKISRKVATNDVFNLGIAAEVEQEIKKSGWKP